ncbi:cytochrome P450 27C1 [Silurus asotus]|uniref:Cytochrome P450 27C1 n=1 Tax=Silurus asotus TaxID=30991 RepID=A0AAD5ACT9_SILAS|nr:cytochrome P450 27C1 [Silurus asotus]
MCWASAQNLIDRKVKQMDQKVQRVEKLEGILYPVVAGNGRLAVENEVDVGGYWFPKQTQFYLCHYAASHDETEFPDAEAFIPERWLRGGPLHSQHHPYSSIPFGVRVRACLGKRVAELEMYFAISRAILWLNW